MIKKWFHACRPWSLTAAFVPVSLGAALAWGEGTLNWWLLALTLVGGGAIQIGTNLFNTWGDYVSGVDTPESAESVVELVHKVFTPGQIRRAGFVAMGIAALVGVYFVALRGWPILVLGLLGIAAGISYTAGPFRYKYTGVGSLAVFFLMGPLMAWGSYYLQTGSHSWTCVLASLPVGFLVSAILHANDMRDLEHDRGAGIRTGALFLGRLSLAHFFLLNVGAYVVLVSLVATGVLPWLALAPLLALPKAAVYLGDAVRGWAGEHDRLALLEPNSGRFHMMFGMLMVLGVFFHPLF